MDEKHHIDDAFATARREQQARDETAKAEIQGEPTHPQPAGANERFYTAIERVCVALERIANCAEHMITDEEHTRKLDANKTVMAREARFAVKHTNCPRCDKVSSLHKD